MAVLLLFPFILLAQQQQHTMDMVTLSRTTKVAPKAMSTSAVDSVVLQGVAVGVWVVEVVGGDSVGAGLEGVVVTWMVNSSSSFGVGVGRGAMIAVGGVRYNKNNSLTELSSISSHAH